MSVYPSKEQEFLKNQFKKFKLYGLGWISVLKSATPDQASMASHHVIL